MRADRLDWQRGTLAKRLAHTRIVDVGRWCALLARAVASLEARASAGPALDTLEKKTRAKAERPRPAPIGPTKGISRHATRAMFERHGDQCCFVDERTGARCPSRAFIQRDHIHMRAHGGSDDAENLRPLCAAHNLWLAEMALGRGYVERRIRFRQKKRTTKQGPGVR